jgi:hypothetical protein
MKTKISGIRVQRWQPSGGEGNGDSSTQPTPPPKPENEDIWSDPPEERNQDGTPKEEEGEGTQELQTPIEPIAKKGPASIGEILPAGSLGGDKGGKITAEERADEMERKAQSDPGNMPGGVKRAFQRMKEPQVDWKTELSRYIDDTVTKTNYTLPSRRFLARGEAQYGYKTTQEDMGTVVVAIDTSGSINRSMIEQFLGEVQSIMDSYSPQKLVILYCDTTVYEPDILEPGDKPDFSKIAGGGGTNFWPPFEWVEKNLIDEGTIPSVFIYFTDGEASFPNPLDYQIESYEDKCIWVFLTFDGIPYPYPQPFGERIDIALANKSIKRI